MLTALTAATFIEHANQDRPSSSTIPCAPPADAIVIDCLCGRAFTLGTFHALSYVGMEQHPTDSTLTEKRRCICRRELTVERQY